jgi:hypothetical protein
MVMLLQHRFHRDTGRDPDGFHQAATMEWKKYYFGGSKQMKAKQIKQSKGEFDDSKPLINLGLTNSYNRRDKHTIISPILSSRTKGYEGRKWLASYILLFTERNTMKSNNNEASIGNKTHYALYGIHRNKQIVVISTCTRNGCKCLKRRLVAEVPAYAQLDICNTTQ